MTAGGLRPRRRDLAGLLLASGTVWAGAGCSRDPAVVPTSTQIPQDPLARLDPVRWDGRTAAEVLALPVSGDATTLDSWAQIGPEDAALDPARRALMDFLEAAYLSPASLSGLDPAAALEQVSAAAPEFWQGRLESMWEGGERHAYGFALAEGFAPVGRPALAMDWYREEREGNPVLLLGGTIAWTVLEEAGHGVGVIAYRLGIGADIAAGDEAGSTSSATLRVTVHGLDTCAVREADGLVVPALTDAQEHRAAQQATLDTVIASPRISREDLLDPKSAPLAGDGSTNAACG